MERIAEKTASKATLYVSGGNSLFGNVVKIEARDVATWRGPYAQYRDAVHARFTPKGKRKARGLIEGYEPYLLILDGHGHPDPDSFLVPTNEKLGSAIVSRGRYTGHDPRWRGDFDAKIGAYLEAHPEVVVVADYRTTKPAEKEF